MSTTKLAIQRICGEHTYTRADALPLYKKIEAALLQGDNVIIDFENKEILSESFLDEGIVEHFMHPRVADAVQRITMKDVSRHDKALLHEIYDYRKRLERKQAAQATVTRKKRTPSSPAGIVRDAPENDDSRKL